MDPDGWRKMLLSKVYGSTVVDLRIAFSSLIKRMSSEETDDNSLSAFLACRLIPLDKTPGLRPNGVGEVIRRVAEKVVMA